MMKLFSLAVLFFLTSNLFAQQPLSVSTPVVTITNNNPTDWVMYVSTSEFTIEYSFVNCDPERGFDYEGVMFKITNLTQDKIALSWHKILFYAGTCRTCDYPEEYSFSISIPANTAIEGDCNPESGYNLKLFSKFIDQAYSQGDSLTAFKLENLTITQ